MRPDPPAQRSPPLRSFSLLSPLVSRCFRLDLFRPARRPRSLSFSPSASTGPPAPAPAPALARASAAASGSARPAPSQSRSHSRAEARQGRGPRREARVGGVPTVLTRPQTGPRAPSKEASTRGPCRRGRSRAVAGRSIGATPTPTPTPRDLPVSTTARRPMGAALARDHPPLHAGVERSTKRRPLRPPKKEKDRGDGGHKVG